jgi:alanyl-tRNA synthetase
MGAATERLYYTDSYLREFEAQVTGRSDDGTRVSLDRTAFYPTSGGQPFDRGSINDVAVVDVLEDGERIVHVLAGPLDAGRIAGKIDWERRFDHMQQHTGQHLLSAVIADLFGYTTVSVHFGDESSTLDLDTRSLTSEQVTEMEGRANAVVTENRPVHITFESAETVAGLRKAPARQGILRIVTIDGLDRSACGGTHVRATGEIGSIMVRRIERVKQSVRVEFLCGGRAVHRARQDQDLMTRLSVLLTAAPEELPALVEALRTDLKHASAERRELEEQLAAYRAAELYAATMPDATGRRLIVVREPLGTTDRLRGLGQAVAAMPGAVFVAAISDPPTVLVATAADSGIDAGRALKAALESEGGKGGGNPRLAQGSLGSQSALEAVIRAVTG